MRRTQFAGDGAAFSGNESWLSKDMLDNSGEPAAIASGLSGVIQNSMINPALNDVNRMKLISYSIHSANS
ncbi:hypothetical protein IPH25_05110 [bacterium]|nr:MAG: hypothetical protein IPG37_02110 [bacterium]QQR61817.1 MAG: hypothetical protein IPH25_05110 [bacterium]QQR62601.1 MAG: hypothetical protein IPH67_04260 [bacterium]